MEEAAADRRIVEATGLLRRARPPSVDRTGMVHCVSTTGWLMTAKKAGPEILVSLSDSHYLSLKSVKGGAKEGERERVRAQQVFSSSLLCVLSALTLDYQYKKTGRDVLAVAFLLSRQLSKTLLDFFRNVSPYTVYSTACKMLGADLAWQRIFGGFVCLIFYAV